LAMQSKSARAAHIKRSTKPKPPSGFLTLMAGFLRLWVKA
jgi:hypothetical protein